MSRNSVAVYDPELARKAAQAELREKAAPKKVHKANELGHYKHELSDEAQQKMAAALQKTLEKMTKMADERRRRDPTFKPDALDLDRSKMRKFNKYVDYYEVLGVDRYGSPSDLKDAYKKKSLALHPDKQLEATEEEKVKAQEQYHAVQKAYDILSEPATRQAYDKARVKLEAEYEAGVVTVDDESTKPPPSCVDVNVPLEELFGGCRKVVRYTRTLFEGTKWEKRTDDTYKLDVRPGELEGATYWFKNEGDVTTGGKADLVFVLSQEEHTTWERVGVDLWYLLPEGTQPIDVESTLFFTVPVPSLEGTKQQRVGTRIATVGVTKQALAQGNCINARLGFDYSGYAEAILPRKGMPLFAAHENARRGLGEVEEREQLTGEAGKKQQAKAVAYVAADISKLERGDLILRMPLKLPSQRKQRTLALVEPSSVCLPPIGLITTTNGQLPIDAIANLITFTVVPAVLTKVAFALHKRKKILNREAADRVLNKCAEVKEAAVASAVLAGADPSIAEQKWDEEVAAADAAKAAAASAVETSSASSAEPAVDVSEPPAAAPPPSPPKGESALFMLAPEPAPPPPPPPPPPPQPVKKLSLATLEELRSDAFAEDVEINEEEMCEWSEEEVREFFESGGEDKPDPSVVIARKTAAAQPTPQPTPQRPKQPKPQQPKPKAVMPKVADANVARSYLTAVCVRVGGSTPTDPSTAAYTTMSLLSSALPQLSWQVIHMVHRGVVNASSGELSPSLLPDEEEAIASASIILLETAPDKEAGGGGGAMVFDPKQGKLVPVAPKPTIYAPPDDGRSKIRDETEEEEIEKGKESDVVRNRGEAEYLSCGGSSALARDVLGEVEASLPLSRCMEKGGVLLAIDHACSLLGQITRAITNRQKKDAAAASLAAAYGTAGAAAPSPPKTASLYGAAATKEPKHLGSWPNPLPFAVGLAPPSGPKDDPCVMTWRRLAGVSKDVDDCCHGHSAVGMPPGCALAVLTDKRCKVRAALGSSQPRLFSQAGMRERIERVASTRIQRKVEAECEKNLAALSGAYMRMGETWPHEARSGGPFCDFYGKARGQCKYEFLCCPGYDIPKCSHEMSLMRLCAHCGADNEQHEAVRTEADKKADLEDDIMKNYKYD